MTILERATSNQLADDLGQLQSEIDLLKTRESEIKGELIRREIGWAEGDAYRATLSAIDRNSVNWKLIATKLGASRQIITAHTRTTSFTQVRVYELED